jgi:hypothetical protein
MIEKKILMFLSCLMIIFLGCDRNEVVSSNYLAKTKFDPLIGEKHNLIVRDALIRAKISGDRSFETNTESLDKYFLEVHQYDGSDMPSKLFGTSHIKNGRFSTSDFDPFEFVSRYQDVYFSETFAVSLNIALSEIQQAHQDSVMMKNVISSLIVDAKNGKFKLREGEKNALLNVLTIMHSSTSIWYSQLEIANKNGRSLYQARKDAWKVVACDGVSGLIGGLMAGPVGALAGIAKGSCTAWLGML